MTSIIRALAQQFNRICDSLDGAGDGTPAEQLTALKGLLGALYDSVLPKLLDVETEAKREVVKLEGMVAAPAPTGERTTAAAPEKVEPATTPASPTPTRKPAAKSKAPAKPKQTAKPKAQPAKSAARTTKPDGAVRAKAPTRKSRTKPVAASKPATPKAEPKPAAPSGPTRAELKDRVRAVNGLLASVAGYKSLGLNASAEKMTAHLAAWGQTAAEHARKLADLLSVA
jgi:outer membrane biosynthesis protein TonB